MSSTHNARLGDAVTWSPYGWMLICTAAICIVLFVVKLLTGATDYQYSHLLVSYEFGIIRRALIGELFAILGIAPARVHVFWLGLAAWLSVVILYLAAFRRYFGYALETIPLFVFTACSPFFLKNFMFTIGYQDIYGCIGALIGLLLPVTLAYLPLMALICILLLFIHHLHFLLYITTIGLIVAIRYHVARGFSPLAIGVAMISIAMICATYSYFAFFALPQISAEEFLKAAAARAGMAELDFRLKYIIELVWFESIGRNMRATYDLMFKNLALVPVYALLILIHAPFIACFSRVVGRLQMKRDRILVVLALVAITVGYLAIFAVIHDYSRLLSNWAVCMILALFAVRLLPSRVEPQREALIDPTPRNVWLAWAVALIPRVGITTPF